MTSSYTTDMEFIDRLGRQAGAELMNYFGKSSNQRYKVDRSLVTDADLASERLILASLRSHYPNDSILSEEAGLYSKAKSPGSSIWIVDPLDGTTNFSNNYPFFCVSIARGVVRSDGLVDVNLGAVYDPVRDRSYVAQKGGGAFLNGKSISVCPARAPEDSFLVTGFAYHRGENLEQDIKFFLRVAQTCQSIRRDGAAALDLALVAEGVYDGYWESGLRPWDVAAGALLVLEAGGIVRNFEKNQQDFFDPDKGDIICGTSVVVDFVSSLIETSPRLP
jgi:myo-inositol-1(or 4)-monophosphatase